MGAKRKKGKYIDVILLLAFPLFSAFISYTFRANLFIATMLFFGLPAAYLSIKAKKEAIKQTAIFTLFTVPVMIVFDYLAALDKVRLVPSIFPVRLYGVVPLEEIIFGALLVYNIVLFYEYFIDKGKNKYKSGRLKYFAFGGASILLLSLVFFSAIPEALQIRYLYLKVGVLFILLPAVAFLSFFPKLISKFVRAGGYFFVLAFLFELTALKLHYWSFPGEHFIGWVEVFGYRFPFEEFFFWFILFAVALLSYYEFFADDTK